MVELSPQDQDRRLNPPPLQGTGRGWGLSAGRLDTLGERAHKMRREPTEPEVGLWRALSRSQLSGLKFRRQAVIGQYIIDFLCPQKALIVEVDGDTHDVDSDRRRDTILRQQGFTVLRVTNDDVMRNLDGVLQAILIALEQASDRWAGLEQSGLAGCFYCCPTYSPSQIEEWIDDEMTALCPKCGIDSVIGSASGHQVDDEKFLKEMNKVWFS